MRTKAAILTAFFLSVGSGPMAFGATITGSVKGPDGAPYKGAWVQAQNKKTRITVHVLSQKDGRYRVDNLAEGSYDVRIRAVGFKSDPHNNVALTATGSAAFDFALQAAPVPWKELSFYEGDKLLPEGKGKELLEQRCLECHSFQNKMAAIPRTPDGWTQVVTFMREAMAYRVRLTDEEATTIASYMNDAFGQEAKLPRNAAEMPGYKDAVHPPFTDDAMKIVYVTYEMPGSTRMPFSAAPDKDGSMWIPYFSLANGIGRLDPKTGAIQEYHINYDKMGGIHSAVPGPDGNVWIAEQGPNRVGKWDPLTKEITEYQDSRKPGMESQQAGGSKHTVRVDLQGRVWSSGGPLAYLDPKTGKFTHFDDVPGPYGITIAPDGTPWFAEFGSGGKIGKVDLATMKVTKWLPPSPAARPRRIQVDKDGIVWFAEFGISPGDGVKYSDHGAGKIGRFDPKTETFKEFPLPGRSPSPYAFGADKDGRWCYSNMHEDVVGCFDPRTEKTMEYPIPFSENTFREFFLDAEGHVWFGSQSNNKVGYFYVANN